MKYIVKMVPLEELDKIDWPVDCRYCRDQIEMAKELKAKEVLVDIESNHIIGIVIYKEER